jgi:GT2 family glycosyltransferase
MPPSTGSSPSVTVIVLNYNGARHLAPCFSSLEGLEYPAVTLMLADNGSTDDSLELMRRRFPGVRVAAMGANLGFAEGYNRAVRAADTEYVALLNNDTRVAATWLAELVDAAARHRSAAASAAILDWDGARIDFVGGLPTAVGHSWQVDYGRPAGGVYEERRLLFGCGGSVLIRRDAYLEAGGFDPDFFAYFEDVDLGWRMNLLGHGTILAPRAITYHRLHGTFGAWSHALRLRLYERNALAMIWKNYGDEALARVLPMAIALALARHLEQAELDASSVRFGAPAPADVAAPARLVSLLIGLEDFARWLPALARKRDRIQRLRRVSDAEIFTLFPEPFKLHDAGERYRAMAEALIHDFRVGELFGFSPPRAVAIAAAPQPEAAVARVSEDRVSVIVLTASGAAHLPDCLDSLRQQSWPAERLEVIVVDNGSAADPTEVAQRHYSSVRIVRTGQNLGFSAGNNAGARVATGRYLLFVNDDTRLAPGCIAELVAAAERRQAACVGALMLDWIGERVDFAGGLVNFEGRGFASHYDERVSTVAPAEAPVLFACGGAVLFRREVFEAAGGWDEPTFAYYEDVEFGWRLWMLGYEVWLAPKAVVYHKHHGTSGPGHAARGRAFERNGLRMIYALLEEERLRRILPAALLLAADRALLATPFSRAADMDAEPRGTGPARRPTLRALTGPLRQALIQRGARRSLGLTGTIRKVGLTGLAGALRDALREARAGFGQARGRSHYLIEKGASATALEGHAERLPVTAGAALLGIHDFLGMLPELSARRAWLQARRKRTDRDIFSRFGDRWTAAVPSARAELHAALRDQVIEFLGISDRDEPAAAIVPPAKSD